VVQIAGERGHDVVVIARSGGVDVLSGAGLTDALAEVDSIIDTLNVGTQRRGVAEEFFRSTSDHLLTTGQAAGVGHHVVLSIIGIDRVPTGYYQGKLAQEAAVAAGRVPWSILRAAQFHEFAAQALDFVKVGPFSLVPRMLSQPVAAREVAAGLVELATGSPVGRAPELAGPEELQVVDLARRVNEARGLGRRVVPVIVPGAAGRAMRSGVLLPERPGPRGQQTFAQWLAS
jgi:hypothetical protein